MDLDRIARHFSDGAMPLIRTDFSSDEGWQRLVGEVTKDSDGGDGEWYTPNLQPLSDRDFEGTTAETLATAWPRDSHGYVVLADSRSLQEAMAGGEVTVVFVDLCAEDEDAELGELYGNSFRCVAGEVASVEANLSIANVDFSEFAGSADHDGVLRGF
ncbi:hypothetical protein G7072_10640 [Nocardioides sp. HDW12B]|uniref:DUF6924 domain-containing protein n=1 Tax=Nocardioides sp. HDW12B TaxID=2714939 RepID=UPI00140796CD|nr:hypothetical protein [Nocardioides sp. HDW12B]QIK66735.1 hypothetical protein G7072_10640 [Nocardioides sp. HDW12B]